MPQQERCPILRSDIDQRHMAMNKADPVLHALILEHDLSTQLYDVWCAIRTLLTIDIFEHGCAIVLFD